MKINEVTIFKLILFTACFVIMSILLTKVFTFDSSSQNMCQKLIIEPEVTGSFIAEECPDDYLPNFGAFSDVKDGYRCCVLYEVN